MPTCERRESFHRYDCRARARRGAEHTELIEQGLSNRADLGQAGCRWKMAKSQFKGFLRNNVGE